MTPAGKKALLALGLLAGAGAVAGGVYYVTRPKKEEASTTPNLPPLPGGGGGGGGGSGGGGGYNLPNPLDPLGIYRGLYDALTKKG